MTMNTGIYQIRNTINGKIYIGSAVNLRERFHAHRGGLSRQEHHNAHLQNAWLKYGPDAFEIRILLLCSKDDLYFYEQRCLDAFDAVKNGYNKSPTAGTVLGIKRTAEYIEKVAASKRGKKQSPEVRAIRRAAMNRPEVRAKMSASCKAAIRKPKTAEHILNAGRAQIGKVLSLETRAKLRAVNLGKKNGPHSEETKLKISLAQKGRPHSDEHISNLCIAQQRRYDREKLIRENCKGN